VLGDELRDLEDVALAFELEADLAETGQPDVHVGVEVEGPRCLDRVSGDLAVRQRGEVSLLARDPLNVERDDPLVREHQRRNPLPGRCLGGSLARNTQNPRPSGLGFFRSGGRI
jgi:hypothetical protein